MRNKILNWQIGGSVFIIMFGSFLHFLFELSGNFPPIGAISAVNESIWEHLKLGYWPLVFFGILEYRNVNKESQNFFLANLVSALLILFIIPVFFYTYTAIIGEHILWLDIFSFIFAVSVGQFVSYKIMMKSEFNLKISYISVFGIIIIGVLFVVFTYFPPQIPLFEDSLTGMYGIPI
ncbi:MAG: conserved membrane protein of unknown function [Promethearchaeota archaeon]|nr:MAG: conserved membrane protein of unknown function [Candidatus Lokiarchaeota archaeon]